MRAEERKPVVEKDGIRITSFEVAILADDPEDFALIERVGKPGDTFTGEIRHGALVIRPQGSNAHSEPARDPTTSHETPEVLPQGSSLNK